MAHSNAERILEASPPVEAIAAEPYSVDELDQLVNKGRVWATIVSLKKPLEEREDEIPREIAAKQRSQSQGLKTLRERIEAFTAEPNEANKAEVLGALDDLEEENDE